MLLDGLYVMRRPRDSDFRYLVQVDHPVSIHELGLVARTTDGSTRELCKRHLHLSPLVSGCPFGRFP
jgi:hypothetical protein